MSTRDAVKIAKDALRRHFAEIDKSAAITVDATPSGMVHIMIVSSHFDSVSQRNRYEEVLGTLTDAVSKDPSVVRKVSRCMLFTPEEYRETYGSEYLAA
jgi:hypothetical protein